MGRRLTGVMHPADRRGISSRTGDIERGPFGEIETATFEWSREFAREDLLDLVRSRSYYITASAAEQSRIIPGVGELLDTDPDLAGRRSWTMPYVTHAFGCGCRPIAESPKGLPNPCNAYCTKFQISRAGKSDRAHAGPPAIAAPKICMSYARAVRKRSRRRYPWGLVALTIAIVGLPNVGKSTLFNALTKNTVLAANYPFATIEPNVGIVNLPDPRLQALSDLFHSERISPLRSRSSTSPASSRVRRVGEGLGNKFLANIREADAIARSSADSKTRMSCTSTARSTRRATWRRSTPS